MTMSALRHRIPTGKQMRNAVSGSLLSAPAVQGCTSFGQSVRTVKYGIIRPGVCLSLPFTPRVTTGNLSQLRAAHSTMPGALRVFSNAGGLTCSPGKRELGKGECEQTLDDSDMEQCVVRLLESGDADCCQNDCGAWISHQRVVSVVYLTSLGVHQRS